MEQWKTLEQQQQNATTSSCQPGKSNHLRLGFAQGLRKKERKYESLLLSRERTCGCSSPSSFSKYNKLFFNFPLLPTLNVLKFCSVSIKK
jgi:hypothetical protein